MQRGNGKRKKMLERNEEVRYSRTASNDGEGHITVVG